MARLFIDHAVQGKLGRDTALVVAGIDHRAEGVVALRKR
jgi:hypothetical protein